MMIYKDRNMLVLVDCMWKCVF